MLPVYVFGNFFQFQNQGLKKISKKFTEIAILVKPLSRCIIAVQFNRNDLTPKNF
jgi:hypothetical protein